MQLTSSLCNMRSVPITKTSTATTHLRPNVTTRNSNTNACNLKLSMFKKLLTTKQLGNQVTQLASTLKTNSTVEMQATQI